MNSMRYLCRHAVYDAMQSIGGFEGMTFVNSHVVYALCASDSQARLIRFEPEGKAYHELGTLSFSALNLAAISSGR